jgi:hypothetical protein
MEKANVVSTHLAVHFKFPTALSPTSDDERSYMEKVPYSSAVGSLMYLMVCTRLDIAQAVSVVSKYFSYRKGALGSGKIDFSLFGRYH